MSKKRQKIAGLVANAANAAESGLNPHYTGYFHCFNLGLFFEAHEVLEVLWLIDRRGAEGAFYKGLIQLAGAFVHLQKKRPGPSAALFRLARANLAAYPRCHHRLDVGRTLAMIDLWQRALEQPSGEAGIGAHPAPRLELLPPEPGPGSA